MNRRNWLRNLSTIGAGAVLVHPKDLLSIQPEYFMAESSLSTNARLSFNENPYSPSPKMKEAIGNIDPELCRYPGAQISALQELIAQREGVDKSNIVITAGSREGLNAVGLHYALQGGEILTCVPTFRALLSYAENFGSLIRTVPLNDQMQFDIDALRNNLNTNTKLVFFCNPNNPTGTIVNDNALEKFCLEASEKCTVFVDEAYYDYIEDKPYRSMKHLASSTHNIIVSRTFSKVYGLAGIRIGYLIAPTDLAKKMNQILMAGTNVMALRLAIVALEDESFYQYSLAKNRQAKEIFYKTFDDLGLKYIRSHTNFVFFQTKKDIVQLIKSYQDRGVEVGRPFAPYNDWCRVSTGKIEDVELFVKVTQSLFV